jgi:hypothetical protein
MLTDGAIARFYTIAEWKLLVSDLFEVKDIKIFGSKTGLILLPNGWLKKKLLLLIPNYLGRLLNTQMKLGTYLFSTLRKNQ